MAKMSIKLKMTLWYGILTTILMMLLLIITYLWLSKSMYGDLEDKIREAAEQVATDLSPGNSDKIKIPTDYSLPNDKMITIIDKNGTVLLDNTNLSWISKETYLTNGFWNKTVGSQEWLIYDKMIVRSKNHDFIAVVRVCTLKNKTASMILSISFVMIAGGILFIALATCGGFFIAAKSLKPIFKIIKTAQEIENGDFSKRISGIASKDEVGILVTAFNSMLENLEASFNREKQFAADASHELRTPVAIIMNSSEQLIRNAKNKCQDSLEVYEEILLESKHMERIISQLLSLVRGQSGKYKINMEKIELCEIISIVIEQLEEFANKKGINILFTKDKNIFLEADQTLIIQLFLNIIENSIKYSKPNGFVKMYIIENSNEIKIEISDNGIGISEEDLPHIFERFYRADKSRDRTGTGLGLSIVKWIVDVHNGTINVESKLNEGTKFVIKLKYFQEKNIEN